MKQQSPSTAAAGEVNDLGGDAAGMALKDLADASGISERTIRFYIVNGLLLGADVAGPQARYPDENLGRLRRIALAQDAGWQLARVREWFERGAPDDEAPRPTPHDRAPGPSRLKPSASAPSSPVQRPLPLPEARRPGATRSVDAAAEDDDRRAGSGSAKTRSSWQRIEIEPGVELHVRRPSTTASNRRVRNLLSFARQLGGETGADSWDSSEED
jgi:DNA-binding transcriptional MerR regulator